MKNIARYLTGVFCLAMVMFPVAASTAPGSSISHPQLPQNKFQKQIRNTPGWRFVLQSVRFGEWNKTLWDTAGQSAGSSCLPPGDKAAMIALTYEALNTDKNRKVDFSGRFHASLTDEFGNQYLQFCPPQDLDTNFFKTGPRFPSIYPGEGITETVFFEAPVGTSRKLMLTMAAPQIGLAEGVTFSVPLVPGRSENAAGQRPERIPSEADLTILSPQPPLEVFPGETVAVRLKTSRELPRPSKILVIAPFYLFEDMYSSLNYRLRIPKDYPPGELTVVLLAYWDRDGAEEGIVSKTLMFRVKAIPVCPPDCQDQDSLRADVMQK